MPFGMRRKFSFEPIVNVEKILMSHATYKIVAVVLMVVGALAAAAVWAVEPAAKTGDCCEQKLACCDAKRDCCQAEKKAGCCAKGMQCCKDDKACCAKAPACCVEGKDCCKESKACCDGKAVAAAASGGCCSTDAQSPADETPGNIQ